MPPATDIQSDRREAIRQLLLEGPQPNQNQLVRTLAQRGFAATQSSVSRDLKDLGAVKTARGYELPASKENDAALDEVAALLRRLKPAGPNLLVIRTATGGAQRVALAMDRGGWADIVGTVAGDDTVFIATASQQDQRRVIARLERAGADA